MGLGIDAKRELDEAHDCRCPYCSEVMDRTIHDRRPTRDHIFPKSRGGRARHDGRRNIIIVCSRCNRDKADLTLEEFHVALVWALDPRAKHVLALIRLQGRRPMPRLVDGNYVWTDRGLVRLGPIEQEKNPAGLAPNGV